MRRGSRRASTAACSSRAPIGEALRAARVECRQNPDSANSPTWLSFVLYGNPGQTLLRGAAVVPMHEVRRATHSGIDALTRRPRARHRPRRPRRDRPAACLARALGLVALLAVAVGLGTWLPRRLQPEPGAPLIVGVMEVQARTPNVPVVDARADARRAEHDPRQVPAHQGVLPAEDRFPAGEAST